MNKISFTFSSKYTESLLVITNFTSTTNDAKLLNNPKGDQL